MTIDAKRVNELMKKALEELLPMHASLKEQGCFEHRGPFFLMASVETIGAGRFCYDESIGGVPGDWEVPFHRIARSKHEISQRTGKDTVDVPLAEREVGDTQYWGSVIREFEGGQIIVAISGLQPWFDEALAGVFASVLLGLLKDEKLVPQGFEPDRDKPPFLTEDYLLRLGTPAA